MTKKIAVSLSAAARSFPVFAETPAGVESFPEADTDASAGTPAMGGQQGAYP